MTLLYLDSAPFTLIRYDYELEEVSVFIPMDVDNIKKPNEFDYIIDYFYELGLFDTMAFKESIYSVDTYQWVRVDQTILQKYRCFFH